MEDNVEPYTFDLNLDFLDSSTTNIKNVALPAQYQHQGQSQIQPAYDIESLAKRIATVNDMVIQIKATKDDNLRLQKQMKDLSESAMSIRGMYDQEKADRVKFTNLYRELQEKYAQTESQLANKTLHFEQIQSRMELESEDKKPISYSELALKYQRLAQHFDEEKHLPSKEKINLQLVREYLESKKLSPLPVFKKKFHHRAKPDVRDFTMQYNFKVESKSQETQCSSGHSEEEPKDTCTQGTQYTWYTTTRGTNTPAFTSPKPEVKTQGTQYISSTTTRGTSTSTFIKTQSVGTNFPEPLPPVSIEDIFKEMIYDVSPLSPMSSQAELKEEKVEMKSVGTCTDLKNVRKSVDYVAASIKHSDSRPSSRNSNLYDRVKNEIPFMGMPTLNPFAGFGIPVTPMHNTVAELWNMLGHTIFALLQQNNGAAAASQLNPMHTNVMNDRIRNVSGRNRPLSEQQRNCDSQTRDDYFEQEYHAEYPPVTRSAATSPTLASELQANQLQSRLPFNYSTGTPNHLVDIQNIILNKNFSDPIVSSSKKKSQVDEILQLFPEYSDSFKKRKAIKRLLKEANKIKTPKKKRNSTSNSSSTSVSTQHNAELPQRPTSSSSFSTSPQHSMEILATKPYPQANWKTEIFGECDSDSSLDNSDINYMNAQNTQADLEEIWKPFETKPPPDQHEWPISSSSLETKQLQTKSPMEEEFFGFEEEKNPQQKLQEEESKPRRTSDEIFCKPFSLPKAKNRAVNSNVSSQKIQERLKVNQNYGGLLIEKTESNEDSQPSKSTNLKRKRKTKKTVSKQSKFNKLEENEILQEPKRPLEPKIPKRSLSLNRTKGNVESILPIKPIMSFDSVNNPLGKLRLNKINKPKPEAKQVLYGSPVQNIEIPKKEAGLKKPDWMKGVKDHENEDIPSLHVERSHHGPMVMKVEKPPDSVFEDIKTCFSIQKPDSVFQDIQTCFINPKKERYTQPNIELIKPNQASIKENVDLPEQQLVAPIDNGTFRFIIQKNQSNVNTCIDSSIKPIQNSETSVKILNCYGSASTENSLERNSKSSITILNEQWIPHTNDLETNKQEGDESTTDVSIRTDHKALDLENMPIYILDDQNMLQNPDQNNDEKSSSETQLKTPFYCPNLSILPGFEEIPRGLKYGSQQILESNGDFKREELKGSSVPQSKHQPVTFQGNHYNLENREAIKNLESIPAAREVKPTQNKTSYLVLNHQKQLKSRESSVIRMQEELVPTRLNFNKEPNRTIEPLKTSNLELMTNQVEESLLQDKIITKSPRSVTTPNGNNISSSSSSDSECNLSIDFPPSPQPPNTSLLDLSDILKTPKKPDNSEEHFKTPDHLPKNDFLLTKVITNSTEKLVEEYLLNESPGEEGPKFQNFLDRILDDVAPPTSPISALALSEKPIDSEQESSCDEASRDTTPFKYKRKSAATAAIAVKRSARISAKKADAQKNMANNLCSLTVPGIELGKYTKRKTDKELKKPDTLVRPNSEQKIDIKLGFFRETVFEEDEEPTCEPIRRHSVEKLKDENKNVVEKTSSYGPSIKLQTDILPDLVQTRFNIRNEDQNQSSVPLKPDSYLSCCKKAKESLSLYLETEESKEVYAPDSPVNSVFENIETPSSFSYESPASPPPLEQKPTATHNVRQSFEISPISKVDKHSRKKSIISHLIANYNHKFHNMLDKSQQLNKSLLSQAQNCIKEFLIGQCHVMDTVRFVDSLIELTSDDKIISKAFANVLKAAPRPETEVTGIIPDTYLSQTHRHLLTVLPQLCHHYPNLNNSLQSTIERSMFTFTKEIIQVEELLNLTQFYLAIINNSSGTTNPARLFICKCLYFFNVKAIPMIYHTLCVYPNVLPKKQDPTYDRSDILISTIQSILMSTYYDPEKSDFMSKQIVGKLRMFYNYENFKPPRDEVIENIMAKIRAGRFKNVPYALSLICKRMEQPQTEKFILNERLMPLANEFYHTFSQTSENDEKIACVLECISFVIKPFDVNTDISQYVNLFGRFLNAACDRKVVQEAAVAAILRTSRFGYVQCFNAVFNFQPTYELSESLKLMFRSFIYKKGKVFLKALEQQAQELLAT